MLIPTHNRIVVASLEGRVAAVIGSGEEGLADGDFSSAQFNHPQGMELDGDILYVADTENHALRKIDLVAGTVSTLVLQSHILKVAAATVAEVENLALVTRQTYCLYCLLEVLIKAEKIELRL